MTYFSVFIVNFDHISHLVLVFLSLILSMCLFTGVVSKSNLTSTALFCGLYSSPNNSIWNFTYFPNFGFLKNVSSGKMKRKRDKMNKKLKVKMFFCLQNIHQTPDQVTDIIYCHLFTSIFWCMFQLYALPIIWDTNRL